MQTPRDAAPTDLKRQLAVEQTMEALEGVESLPVEEQLERLSAAQDTLARILRGEDVTQANIPGLQ